MRSRLAVFVILLSCTALSGCSTASVDSRKDNALLIAAKSGFSAFSVQTDTFRLAGFSNASKPISELTVYIEGDGLAWLDRYTVSSNPTPKNPLALKLATKDPSNGVLYLARPCQYVNIKTQSNCNSKYWTSHRFAKEVISSYEQAIDILKRTYQATGVRLVGYSGGGAIAALLAARRADVLSLITVAGNLDHVALSKYHRASILTGSLNPISVAASTYHIPQVHYSGSKDKIVPNWIAKSFSNEANAKNCSKHQSLQNIGHSDGWDAIWARLVGNEPKCQLQ